jgi:hypothetical protein
MTAQLFNLDAERKARRIGRESPQCVFLAPVRIGASLTKTWLDASLGLRMICRVGRDWRIKP